jgi:hypothetical protein
MRNGEQTPPSAENGKQNRSSSIKDGKKTSLASGKEERMPRGRRLRESRKTPFRVSPTPRVFNAEDNDLDEILEAQRQEDMRTESSVPEAAPKRKREVISDSDYRLRKERTDNLVEGLRHVRERLQSPSRRSPSTERLEPEAEEEREASVRKNKPAQGELEPPLSLRGGRRDDQDSDDDSSVGIARQAFPNDFDPPPFLLSGGNKDDPDSDEDSSVGVTRRDFTALRVEDGGKGGGKCQGTRVILSVRQLRRIMAAKESLFKFGVFVPKSAREAESSPEAPRWKAGLDLEWLRLKEQGTFERDWTWKRIQEEFITYKKSDIGFLFYVFDYKFSGEHRVRLVFDGSRQSEDTYDETYAPTARQESVRLFHVVCVEESYGIGQYDVPQAFLKAFIDFDIFVYPPRGQAEFDGQILKLRRALYGGKQSAFLWFKLMNEFILGLGFVASTFDKCLYRREDAVIVLFCDDLRIGASDPVLQALHSAFFTKFGITTASGDRFLGMDTSYQRDSGVLKLSMETYISNTMDRFNKFDVSQGYPYREIVGCLLWITLCVMGPELLRVKDLARKSNDYEESDYLAAVKVLKRVYARREYGIVITRGAVGRELVPSSERPAAVPEGLSGDISDSNSHPRDDTGDLIVLSQGELIQKSLFLAQRVSSLNEYAVPDPEQIDIGRVLLPVNPRYGLVVYADASFAIGERKQSVSGYVVYLNGVPILWGSLKQTIVVDSSCSAEFVAASIACKQLLHAENMVGFFGFSCPKPYRFYTDSKACLHIATNLVKLGNVRHLQIRYHLVRCCVCLGDLEMHYCVTEEMVADLFTKLVAAAQDSRLVFRFYSLVPTMHVVVGSNDFKRSN